MAAPSSPKWKQRDGNLWQERVQVMQPEWRDDGWVIASVQVLKMQSSYKITVEYERILAARWQRPHIFLYRSVLEGTLAYVEAHDCDVFHGQARLYFRVMVA